MIQKKRNIVNNKSGNINKWWPFSTTQFRYLRTYNIMHQNLFGAQVKDCEKKMLTKNTAFYSDHIGANHFTGQYLGGVSLLYRAASAHVYLSGTKDGMNKEHSILLLLLILLSQLLLLSKITEFNKKHAY